MNPDPTALSVEELASALRGGQLRATALVDAHLRRIEGEAELNALTTVFADAAREQAEAADAAFAAGDDPGPLVGIPIAIKDSIPTKGLLTTCNSRSRVDWVPGEEPLAITRLRRAGAIVLAKATPNEFLGIPSDDDLYPRPRNAFNRDHVAIGSSSGAGPAVAAGLCAASIGSDSAGSVRLPAAQHGLVGLKATRGRVPSAVDDAEPTLQVLGALTRTVGDTRLLFDVMRGAREPATGERDGGGREGTRETGGARGPEGAPWPRVGVPSHYVATAPVEDEIRGIFAANLEAIAAAGAQVTELRPRGWAEGRMATFVVLYTEHHAAHRDALRRSGDAYGRSARLYALQGAFISAADYLRCRGYGERLRVAVEALFDDVDVLVMPTSPFVTAEAARRPGEHRQGLNTVFTGLFNLTGHPAVTIPCGVSALGIPVGLQLVGRFGADEALLEHAQRMEAVVRPRLAATA